MTPALSHIEEAERLIFPKYASALQRGYLAEAVPAIAQTLANRDEKLAQAGLRIEALEAEAKRLRQTIHSMSMGEPS